MIASVSDILYMWLLLVLCHSLFVFSCLHHATCTISMRFLHLAYIDFFWLLVGYEQMGYPVMFSMQKARHTLCRLQDFELV
jgi:hypothetical protein